RSTPMACRGTRFCRHRAQLRRPPDSRAAEAHAPGRVPSVGPRLQPHGVGFPVCRRDRLSRHRSFHRPGRASPRFRTGCRRVEPGRHGPCLCLLCRRVRGRPRRAGRGGIDRHAGRGKDGGHVFRAARTFDRAGAWGDRAQRRRDPHATAHPADGADDGSEGDLSDRRRPGSGV
ncbi:hypothetical protein OY671_009226, partial [Metschnikowia pulcherrima]